MSVWGVLIKFFSAWGQKILVSCGLLEGAGVSLLFHFNIIGSILR